MTTVFDRVTVHQTLAYVGASVSSDRDLISCPLPGHDDSTPSFKIVDGRGWTCFGSDRKGGIADLIVAFGNGSTHADAARWLESKLGVTTSQWAPYTYRGTRKARDLVLEIQAAVKARLAADEGVEHAA